MIDQNGYRANVGIILTNQDRKVFWAKRIGQNAWQFPQGGVDAAETPEEAMYRELREETGLLPEHVDVVGCTRRWLHYDLPKKYVRKEQKPLCIGQKQIWFLLRFVGDESDVDFAATNHPEFDQFEWVDYWQPSREVIYFKRDVYRRALKELAPLVGVKMARHPSRRRRGVPGRSRRA